MWLRRIGLPPLWPSRLKVTFMAILQTSFIYSFTSYLVSADVDYLDLGAPKQNAVTCKQVQVECVDNPQYSSPLQCMLDKNELLFGAIHIAKALPGVCAPPPNDSCGDFSLSVRSIHEDLGRLHTTNRWLNPLRLWAFLFALLTGVFIIVVSLHDHALIMPWCRPNIKSLRSLQREMPVWWRVSSWVQLYGSMSFLRARFRVVWMILLPLWWIYRGVVFVAVVYPITWMASYCMPIGMSRFMVFSTSLLLMITALSFSFSVLVVEGDMYGLFWNAPSQGLGCTCYCEYPLQGAIKGRLVFLGLVVFVGAFSVAFRSLKGLRRANWGNLFSVLYTVPVEIFPVRWEKPKEAGGGPITFRTEGQDVQGEPAFDPFCLMDEQPESGASCARLRPEPQSDEQRDRWERVIREAEIGCCGFPFPVEEGKVRSDSDVDDFVVDQSTTPSRQSTTTASQSIPVNGVVLTSLPQEEAGGNCLFEGGTEASAEAPERPPLPQAVPPTPLGGHPPAPEPSGAHTQNDGVNGNSVVVKAQTANEVPRQEKSEGEIPLVSKEASKSANQLAL